MSAQVFPDCRHVESGVYSEDRSPRPTLSEVATWTLSALVAFQEDLQWLGDGYQPRSIGERRMAIENFKFVHAVISTGIEYLGPGRVKRLQVRAAEGKPLTICAGLPRLLGDWSNLQPVSDAGWRDGCGRVCPDSAKTRPGAFVAYCQDCRKRKPKRRRGQWETALYSAQLDDRLWGFSYTSAGVVYVTRCRCGSLVSSDDVRQTCCARCRKKRR